MTKSNDAIVDALTKSGLALSFNGEQVLIEPTVLRLKSMEVNTIKRGMYKTDPRLVPEELKEDNILWVEEPAKYTAITESGDTINIYLSEGFTHNHKVIHPDD